MFPAPLRAPLNLVRLIDDLLYGRRRKEHTDMLQSFRNLYDEFYVVDLGFGHAAYTSIPATRLKSFSLSTDIPVNEVEERARSRAT